MSNKINQKSSDIRYLDDLEQWTLYYFETHVRGCSKCINRGMNNLCNDGKAFADLVTKIVYSMRQGKDIYCARAAHAIPIAVAMPRNYDETRELLAGRER